MTTRVLVVRTDMELSSLSKTVFDSINRVVCPLARRGVVSPPPVGGGVVVLETTGRRSGLPREVPLLATRLGDRLYVSTVRTGSQWVRNAEADPRVGVWLHGFRRDGIARSVADRSSSSRWRSTLASPRPEPKFTEPGRTPPARSALRSHEVP